MKKILLITILLILGVTSTALAGPSAIVWIPSTDIQSSDKTNFGITNYFTSPDGDLRPTDYSLEWGYKSVEFGIDYLASQANPFLFNAKISLLATEKKFNLVTGVYNVGLSSDTDQSIVYILASQQTKDGTRLSLGYGIGKSVALQADNNNSEMILTGIDKQFNDKWWGGVDYQSGNSNQGALNFGISYNFTPDISVIFGYDIYNNSQFANTANTQVSIKF